MIAGVILTVRASNQLRDRIRHPRRPPHGPRLGSDASGRRRHNPPCLRDRGKCRRDADDHARGGSSWSEARLSPGARKPVARKALEAAMEHMEIAQKRIVEEMAEMSTADDALEHGRKGGRATAGLATNMEVLPQYLRLHLPTMSTVKVVQRIEERAGTAATEQNPAGCEANSVGAVRWWNRLERIRGIFEGQGDQGRPR